nr:hypothetical protein [Clostridium sp. cel8]
MRKRRIRIFLVSVFCLAFIILISIYLTGMFKTALNDVGKEKKDLASQTQKTSKKSSTASVKNNSVNDEDESLQYTVELSDGKSVNLVYENKDNNKIFKDVIPKDANVAYSISPSGKNALIFDSKIQSILLFDTNGNKEDITNPEYVSSSGTVISKDNQLSSNPNYIWCSSPKFIDDDNIAYISQLPWLNKSSKYIWIENIQNKSHIMVQSIEGQNIEFGDITDKGLTVNVDSNTIYLKSTGEVSQ